jgi:hypothetical protein
MPEDHDPSDEGKALRESLLIDSAPAAGARLSGELRACPPCPPGGQLVRLARQELDQEASAALRAHFSVCPSCFTWFRACERACRTLAVGKERPQGQQGSALAAAAASVKAAGPQPAVSPAPAQATLNTTIDPGGGNTTDVSPGGMLARLEELRADLPWLLEVAGLPGQVDEFSAFATRRPSSSTSLPEWFEVFARETKRESHLHFPAWEEIAPEVERAYLQRWSQPGGATELPSVNKLKRQVQEHGVAAYSKLGPLCEELGLLGEDAIPGVLSALWDGIAQRKQLLRTVWKQSDVLRAAPKQST